MITIAGLTGLLLAATALWDDAGSSVKHLCNLNPHVASALRDWSRTCRRTPHIPRQRLGDFPSTWLCIDGIL